MVLLVSFLHFPPGFGERNNMLDVIDLFSGKGRISKLAKWFGYNARAYDLSYHPVRYPQKRKRGRAPRSCMDLNGAAGLVHLSLKQSSWFTFYINIYFTLILPISQIWNAKQIVEAGNHPLPLGEIPRSFVRNRCGLF